MSYFQVCQFAINPDSAQVLAEGLRRLSDAPTHPLMHRERGKWDDCGPTTNTQQSARWLLHAIPPPSPILPPPPFRSQRAALRSR